MQNFLYATSGPNQRKKKKLPTHILISLMRKDRELLYV